MGLLLTAFGFGFRHGIDWDHLAALTDITGTERTPRRSMVLATLYAGGHALVVFALGLVAVLLSSELPDGVDVAMQHLVGATLIVFGLYVLVSLVRRGREFRLQSRWMLIIRGVRRVLRRERVVVVEHEHEHAASEVHDHSHVHAHAGAAAAAPSRHSHVHRHVAPMPDDPFASYTRPTVFGVGMLHGIGGETPTQVLVFAAAAGAGGRVGGVTVLAAFIVGLVASNTAVALASTFGFVHATKRWSIYATISVITALCSVAVGALFVAGHGAVLPTIFGG